jgi:two-component system nitrate/nitrite response regulator NarL
VPPLRVVVAGDDPLGRHGLAALLVAGGELTVVEESDLDRLPAAVRAHQPDAVVWDVGLAPSDAADLARDVGAVAAPVLAVVADEASALPLLAAGIRGLVLRRVEPSALVAAVQAVAADLTVLDGAARDALVTRRAAAEPLVEPLTPREREVLALLAQGMANRAIGERLGISEHTAKFHVNAILGKLGAQTRAEAVVHAIRLGLVVL